MISEWFYGNFSRDKKLVAMLRKKESYQFNCINLRLNLTDNYPESELYKTIWNCNCVWNRLKCLCIFGFRLSLVLTTVWSLLSPLNGTPHEIHETIPLSSSCRRRDKFINCNFGWRNSIEKKTMFNTHRMNIRKWQSSRCTLTRHFQRWVSCWTVSLHHTLLFIYVSHLISFVCLFTRDFNSTGSIEYNKLESQRQRLKALLIHVARSRDHLLGFFHYVWLLCKKKRDLF